MEKWIGQERRTNSPNERVAVLELEVATLKTELDDINRKLDSILSEMTRYKGFLGGITFIISGAYVAWQIAGEHIRRMFA